MTSPISRISSLTIGTVESVSPDKIEVLLDTDAPRSTALNTGVPTPFPRINSFVLLPNESGAVVGIVVWLGVERSAYPKRQGFKDFGLIDLPFPLRKMAICPIGTLLSEKSEWRLERGVQSFPSVGDLVILPTNEQTIAIVTGRENDSRVMLGTCPIARDAPVTVDPDKLFGRHLAILGNTGSGKSCTLAALIRASIESAQTSIGKKKTSTQGEQVNPNTRFIIFDPNGEYSKCFRDLGAGCRVFQVPPLSNKSASEFTLPAWMWNSAEWAAVTRAASGVQRPLLKKALRKLRAHNEDLPIRFVPKVLAKCLKLLANEEGGSTPQHISTLAIRIEEMLSDPSMHGVINPEASVSLSDWLEKHIGADAGENGPVSVIDLSLVPYEILHLVIGFAARLILESLQRYQKINTQSLPTVLVLEEAHTFVGKRRSHRDEIPSPTDMCRRVFERIAREGRKFGLGLVLSSQRPSELSETVLSQCNSFLLHRITNDRDQDLIARLVPDNARGLLRELPSLPTRRCILLGIASMIPVLVEVKHLRGEQKPESDDPEFWEVWTKEKKRPIDWEEIVRKWTGVVVEDDVVEDDDVEDANNDIPF